MLLTGFEPFSSASINPSWDAAREVAQQWDGDASVVAARLPVEFAGATVALGRALHEHRPDVVIALGLAEGRTAITPERVAINLADARIPDNAGAQPIDVPVVPGAPDGLLTTLPVKEIVQAVRRAGIPAELSHTAGTYVCNHVFFALQHRLRGTGARSGFLHLPASANMLPHTQAPTLEQSVITRAVRIAVEAALSHAVDTHVSEGTVH